MSLFAVLFPAENPALQTAIKEKFPENNYKITSTQWIISGKGTAQQISDMLGITKGTGPGTSGLGVVLGVSSYWGRADAGLWEWMKVKTEEGDNG
ncbi:MAG: hypothetical protein ACYDFU_01330 [Nitrospirota bacterium]